MLEGSGNKFKTNLEVSTLSTINTCVDPQYQSSGGPTRPALRLISGIAAHVLTSRLVLYIYGAIL